MEAVQADAERGMVGALDDPPRVLVVVDVATPRERLVGDPSAAGGARARRARAAGRRPARRRRSRPARRWSTPAAARAPSSCISANFASGAREVRLGHRPRSRETAGRDRASGQAPRAVARPHRAAAATRSGRARTARRRRSRLAAVASSFSSRLPLRQTVAIERLTPSAPRNGAASVRDLGTGR